MNFEDLSYLKQGNSRQKLAYEILMRHQILSKLSAFKPILVGTIPIGIDIKGSDLDIVCQYGNMYAFFDEMEQLYSEYPAFEMMEQPAYRAAIVRFILEDFPVEIFSQNIPPKEQLGYRHMIIEHRLLIQRGEIFRNQIVELKKSGIKTEPAFAILLGLHGDPYQALLDLE